MKRGACGNVGVMGAGLRPIGKLMDLPPDPTMLRALHFYPNLGSSIAEGDPLGAPIDDRPTGRLIGASRPADYDNYEFFEPELRARWEATVQAFKGDLVSLVSASEGFKEGIVLVDGHKLGYQYELVHFETGKSDRIGDVYDGIAEPLEVRRIDYPAGDGLRIPAYLTLPRGRAAQKLPLVVLVHGGPAARDTPHFDWWSQALADQGYAVLRPNYRGSTISDGFVAAGFGEYGRKMQTDLSDGVRYLAKEGIVDPTRVCVVGASYGGYAALAGVTLEAGVYRCAVSVAGLSDLKQFLRWVNEKHRERESIEQRYWDRFMGVTSPSDPVLRQISPIHHVDSIKVPILLIHGKDDTVVPYDQSDDMYEALRHAKKGVEFVQLPNEDHWLSRGETRLQMLQTSVAFLRKNNPPD
jgi:dipeptidyl aminopeptidase/acylaminoacyl peptidase